jgi:hypothetical protein
MKKLFGVLFLSIALLAGCQQKADPVINTVPANALTEKDGGKTFAITKGGKISFSFKVDSNEDFFWSAAEIEGDIEVLADARTDNRQNIVVVVNSPGALKFAYIHFSPTGAKTLNEVIYRLRLK